MKTLLAADQYLSDLYRTGKISKEETAKAREALTNAKTFVNEKENR